MKKTYMPFWALLAALYITPGFTAGDETSALASASRPVTPTAAQALPEDVLAEPLANLQIAPITPQDTSEDPQDESLLLSMLPNEMLLHIFSLLPNQDLKNESLKALSLTCKRLNSIINLPLFSQIYLSPTPEFNVEAFLNFCCTPASAKFWPGIKTIKGKAPGIFWDPTYPYYFTEADDLSIPYQLLPHIIDRLPPIQRLGIMPRTIEYNPEDLRENSINLKPDPSITKLTLTDYRMGPDAQAIGNNIEILFPLFPHLKNITSLIWSGCYSVSPQGLDQLVAGLGHLTQLKSLMWDDFPLPESTIKRIAPVLGTLSQLERLNLAHNFLSGENAQILARELPKLKNLKELCLDNNPLGNEGANAIVKACLHLPSPCPLKKLSLTETRTDKATEEKIALVFGLQRPDVNLYLGKI